MDISTFIQGFEITGCYVLNRDSIAFVCQKWEVPDALVPHETRVLTFHPSENEGLQWKTFEIGTTTGLHCCPVYQPSELWTFATDLSDVLTIDQGQVAAEGRVAADPKTFTFNLKCIDNGHAYAVGPNRSVYRRDEVNVWIKLDAGLANKNLGEKVGFRDIDGFSETDVYACGGKADLWRFDGNSWSKTDLPTNVRLKYIRCGGDDYVYIVTDLRNAILRGRGDVWEFVEKDVSRKELLGKIVWFAERLHLLTTKTLYVVGKEGFSPIDMSACHLKSYSQMASGDGLLVVASPHEAALFDGQGWTPIISMS